MCETTPWSFCMSWRAANAIERGAYALWTSVGRKWAKYFALSTCLRIAFTAGVVCRVIGHGFVCVSRRFTPRADVTIYGDTAWARVCYGWLYVVEELGSGPDVLSGWQCQPMCAIADGMAPWRIEES